jgi:hypothetical protein
MTIVGIAIGFFGFPRYWYYSSDPKSLTDFIDFKLIE